MFATIPKIERVQIPYSMIKADSSSLNDAAEIILEEVRKDPELRIESNEEGYMRAQLAKQFLKTFFQDRKEL